EWMMASFGIKTPITLASTMKLREEPTDRLVDICRTVGASVYLAGAGATNYMDLERFTASGITMEVQAFQHPVYRQCYDPFVFGLSAVDLLFTWGDGALAYLREARAGGASAQSGSAREGA
ncbi:MAG: WbqC family protein, partial [bacterium]